MIVFQKRKRNFFLDQVKSRYLRSLNFFDKLIFLFNSLAASLLLFSYILKFLPPQTFKLISILSLFVPLLLILNLFFCLYWLLKFKKQILLSLLVLGICFSDIRLFVNFNLNNDFSNGNLVDVMSYNVHLLNIYGWIDTDDVPLKLETFLKKESPDILCIQEFESSIPLELNYEYSFAPEPNNKSELLVFSKFPIIKTGIIEFEKSSNRAIFCDLKVKSDTIRVYNVHLQSTGIIPGDVSFNAENTERVSKRLSSSFVLQQIQAEMICSHMKSSPYKNILCGDFNNTAHSYTYQTISREMKDSFRQAGNGFGRTFDFDYFPLRIDFILADSSFEIISHKTFPVKYSDHFPISSTIKY